MTEPLNKYASGKELSTIIGAPELKSSFDAVCNIAGMGPTLFLDFTANDYRIYSAAKGLERKALTDILTTTRASTGGIFNALGQYDEIASGAPRLDFDPSTGLCRGLLVEESRVNSCLWSEDFTNAVWAKTSGSVTANQVIAPDGELTADTFTASGANATILQPITTTAASWTFSIFIKRKTGTGAVSITMNGSDYVDQTVSSTDWTRFYVAQTCTAGTSQCGVKLASSGDEVYLFGGQAE